MRNFFRFILPVVLVVVSMLLVVVGGKIAKSKRPEQKDTSAQGMLVDVIVASPSSRNFVVESQGTVRARTETTLVAEVAGKVDSVSANFVAGGFFHKGDVLLQIDPSDYEAALKRAEANLASREAQLAQEQARSDQALKDWQNLNRSGQPSDLVLRKPQLAEAKANIKAATAELQKARRDLQRTRIRVPYDGLVKEKGVDIGQYVAPGTRLGITFAVDTAEVRLPLPADELVYLELPVATPGEDKNFPPVTLSSDTGGIYREWRGTIIRTEGVVDEKSRMVYAVAQVPDPYGVFGTSRTEPLPVGTFVKASIDGKPASNLLVLPRSVLRNDNTVLIADGDTKLAVRAVSVVRTTPDYVYISSGLDSAERVVTTAIEAPIPGTQLAINNGEESDAINPEGLMPTEESVEGVLANAGADQ